MRTPGRPRTERPPRVWQVLRAGSRRRPLLGVLAVWAAVERFTGVKLAIGEVRPGGLLRCNVARRRGPPIVLRDGTPVLPGDLIVELHLDNGRLGGLSAAGASPWALLAAIREDLRALAADVAAGRFGRVVALHGETLLADAGPRLGFERIPRRHTPAARLERFFFAGLVALHNPSGWRAVRQKSRRWPADLWMGCSELACRYGVGAQAAPDRPVASGKT